MENSEKIFQRSILTVAAAEIRVVREEDHMSHRFEPLRTAGILVALAAPWAVAQNAAQPEAAKIAVHGACQTAVRSGVSDSATCNFTYSGIATDAVPAGKQLLIEHASAICTGPQDGEIAYLSIHTLNAPSASTQPDFLPLVKRPPHIGFFIARYTASAPVRLYAAANTQVTVTLMLDSELPNYQPTACDIRFQGHLADVKTTQ